MTALLVLATRSAWSRRFALGLVVGVRTGPVQLLLYAVFHLGNATNKICFTSAQAMAQHRAVAWVVCHSRWATATTALRCWAPMRAILSNSNTLTASRWCWRRAGASRRCLRS